ncbi:hypothetical protein HU200_056556 [Digitaria exilis]|uniref:NAC domain-containing protein n=1 Tax=Digitaria exilis TaxID=1010633 RepID=A0A835E0R4_9POAL|nr:hypothetical protein HU200_056556 [Digitaria exilis]
MSIFTRLSHGISKVDAGWQAWRNLARRNRTSGTSSATRTRNTRRAHGPTVPPRLGFWKATGRDKPIYANKQRQLVGMRKTLVYYKGRAPNGHKSDWIMHEYPHPLSTFQEEGWVVCRVFKKRLPTTRRESDHDCTMLVC